MDKLEQEIWKTKYIEPMFEKYKEIPTDLKYLFIEKDYSQMFGGKREAEDRMRYLYHDSETFIFVFENALCEFTKTVRKNLLKKYWESLALDEWLKIKGSGSYFKHFSGKWLQDKEYFCNFVAERENNKEYVKQVLR